MSEFLELSSYYRRTSRYNNYSFLLLNFADKINKEKDPDYKKAAARGEED